MLKKCNQIEYFQCLQCKKFFATLTKVEKHVKQHEGEEKVATSRGRLPIQKFTFKECYVSIRKDHEKRDNSKEDESDKSTPSASLSQNGNVRGLRKSRIKAVEKIRQLSSVLKASDKEKEQRYDEDDDEDYSSSSYSDEESREKVTIKAKLKRRFNDYVGAKRLKIRRKDGPACEFCPATFTCKKDLRHHLMKNHPGQSKVLSCPVKMCLQRFLSFFSLRTHLNLHCYAEENELKPEMANQWNENRNKKYMVDFYTCKYCLTSCKSLKKLVAHVKRSHEQINLKCQFCSEVEMESRITEYLSHIIKMHSDKMDPFKERYKYRTKNVTREKFHPDKKFKCELCLKGFSDVDLFQRHKKRTVCVVKNQEVLDKMKNYKPEKGSLTCEICKRNFRTSYKLKNHVNLHLGKSQWVCILCDKQFAHGSALKRHQVLHIENIDDRLSERVKCPHCSVTVSRKDKLLRHIRICAEANKGQPNSDGTRRIPKLRVPYNAQIVKRFNAPSGSTDSVSAKVEIKNENSRVLPTKSIDVKQEEIHLTDKIILTEDGEPIHIKGEILDPDTITTTTTKSIGATPDDTKNELKEVPGYLKSFIDSIGKGRYCISQNKVFKCSICPEEFQRAWMLEKHLLSVHKTTILEEVASSDGGQIKLMCGTCAYPAKDAEDLDDHIKKDHARFKCYLCGFSFATRKRMEQHVRQIHHGEGERKHVCKVCSRAYIGKEHLRRHLTSHEEKVECRICKRKLVPRSIRAHMKKHDRERRIENGEQIVTNFECKLCKDFFANALVLKRHIDAIHLGKPVNKKKKVIKGSIPHLNDQESVPLPEEKISTEGRSDNETKNSNIDSNDGRQAEGCVEGDLHAILGL